jgi:glycosyltransferase involved in cell wall biosynthesis
MKMPELSPESRVTALEHPVAHALRRAGSAAAGAALRASTHFSRGRSVESVARRVARRILRRIGFRRTDTDSVLLRLRPRPPIPWPALSVVVRQTGAAGSFWPRVEDALRRQTIRSVEWLIWDEADGSVHRRGPGVATAQRFPASGMAEVRQLARGALMTWASEALAAFPTTWLESALWVGVGEGLPAVVFDAGPRRELPARAAFSDRLVVRRELWGTEDGIDTVAFRALAQAEPVLAKIVRAGGGPPFPIGTAGDAPVLPAGFPSHRVSGPYVFSAAVRPGSHEIGISPFETTLVEPPDTDPRPTVLVLMPFLAIGGAEKLTLDVMRELGERFRFVVVTLVSHDPVLGDCIAEFRKLIPHVYTLGELLPPQLFFSALSHVIRSLDVRTLFNANGTTFFFEALSSIREAFPRLRIVNQLFDHTVGWVECYSPQVAADVDAHVATNDAIEQELVERRAVPVHKVFNIPHGIVLQDFRPADYGCLRVEGIRSRLGVPAGRTLVSLIVRMHPQKRPLDFVSLAERFRGDDDFFFLLVGGGPMERTVDERIAAASLQNARRIGFFSPLPDLLAATDVVCMTSEYEALPLVVLSGLAMERPVVATDVGAIRSVLADGPCGLVVPEVGDLGAFRDALESLRDPERRSELGRRGRGVVERRFSIARCARQYAAMLLGEEEPGA